MADEILADTNYGQIRGAMRQGTAVFKGVPYAGSPQGDARFKAPAKPATWTGVRDCVDFGPRAIQSDNSLAVAPAVAELFQVNETAATGEDCRGARSKRLFIFCSPRPTRSRSRTAKRLRIATSNPEIFF